jgi:hypothetical protein
MKNSKQTKSKVIKTEYVRIDDTKGWLVQTFEDGMEKVTKVEV